MRVACDFSVTHLADDVGPRGWGGPPSLAMESWATCLFNGPVCRNRRRPNIYYPLINGYFTCRHHRLLRHQNKPHS